MRGARAFLLVLSATLAASIGSGGAGGAGPAHPVWALAKGGPRLGIGISVWRSTATGWIRLTRPTGHTVDEFPAWSPDGARLAFVRRATGGPVLGPPPVSRQAGLDVVTVSGRSTRRIVKTNEGLAYIVWAPDGRSLAFVAGQSKIEVVRADGTDRHVIITMPRCCFVDHVSWSPNSRRIVCACGTGVVSVNADGSNLRHLARGATAFASWSPDGTRIAFGRRCTSGAGGDLFCDIAFMAADGSGKKTLLAAPQALEEGHVPWLWTSPTTLLVPGSGSGIFLVNINSRKSTLVLPTKTSLESLAVGAGGVAAFMSVDNANHGSIILTTPDGRFIARHPLPDQVSLRSDTALWCARSRAPLAPLLDRRRRESSD